MIAWSTVEDALRTWLVVGSGLADTKVVWSDEPLPRPAPPYITIGLTAVRTIGQDWKTVSENPLVFADFVVVANAPLDALDAVAHGLQTGDGPFRLTTTGSAPAGLSVGVDYWAIRISADRFQVASTFQNAIALVEIAILAAGTGVHSIVDTADTRRAGQEIIHGVKGRRELIFGLQCFDGTRTGVGSCAAILEKVKTALRLPSVHAGLRTAHVGVAGMGNVVPIRTGSLGVARFEPRAILEVRAFISSEVSEISTFISRARVMREAPLPQITFTVDRDA